VRSIGGALWVDLKGVGGCVDHSAPDVSAEVSCPTVGSCRIVNFHYPSPGAGLPPFDLRSELKRMRDERARPVSADDHGGTPSAARRSN
jgi:hypothetical protein